MDVQSKVQGIFLVLLGMKFGDLIKEYVERTKSGVESRLSAHVSDQHREGISDVMTHFLRMTVITPR